MRRDLDKMAARSYDVLIVGGGVYGAALAREAALSGLATALVERGDFGGATSANSLKIIHGGLRYLQQADVARLRTSVVERRTWLRLAPHLVHPLPCAMPTRGGGTKSRAALRLGLWLNDFLSANRDTGSDPAKHIPGGRVVSAAEARRALPELGALPLTGAAFWHDAYAYNTERLVLGLVRAAAAAGADVANYLRVVGFKRAGRRVEGVLVRDALTGREMELTATLVVNNTGPWVNETLDLLGTPCVKPLSGLALGMNVVLRRGLCAEYAIGLPARGRAGERERLLFFMPWRGRTLAGTYYRPHAGPPDALRVTDDDRARCLDDLQRAWPTARIQPDEVAFTHLGALPAVGVERDGRTPVLARHFQIVDHAACDGLKGLITVLGVKYTTARDVAARTVRLMLQRLPCASRPARSDERQLPGGDIPNFTAWWAATVARQAAWPASVARHLALNYGTELDAVLMQDRGDATLLRPLGSDCDVVGAEAVFAAREEMAQTLADVLYRRTDLASAGLPSAATLEACAAVLARACGWDTARVAAEMDAALAHPSVAR